MAGSPTLHVAALLLDSPACAASEALINAALQKQESKPSSYT